MSFIRKWLSREVLDPKLLAVGRCVRVARTHRSPMPGELGSVIDISLDDNRGPFVVKFSNGLQFRYIAKELELVSDTLALETDLGDSDQVDSLALKRASG